MPVRRAPIPVFLADRATVLNADITPTARLTYVLLLASLEESSTTLQDVARLAGLGSADELRPYLDELERFGAADVKEHAGQGQVVTVNETPLLPEQRTHACIPCEDCGNCSCQYMKGLCQECYAIRSARDDARRDIARWQQQVDEGKTYAIGTGGSRLHRWDCKLLNNVDKSQSMLEAGVEALRRGEGGAYMYWPRLPALYTAEELRLKGVKKRNCAICGPDPL